MQAPMRIPASNTASDGGSPGSGVKRFNQGAEDRPPRAQQPSNKRRTDSRGDTTVEPPVSDPVKRIKSAIDIHAA